VVPNVSIIMPAYNHANFIGEAIESVLNQSYEEFEFVIVDDGSTDNTADVVKKYNDSRIKYHYQQNADAFNAINSGISLSSGDIISIINSDDVYHPQRIEKMLRVMSITNSLLIFTDLDLIDMWSNKLTNMSHPFNELIKSLRSKLQQTGSLKQTLISGNLAVTTSNIMFSKKLVEAIGRFKPYRYAHDYDFILRALSLKEGAVTYIPEQLLSYRVHFNNTISENPAKVHIETFTILLENLTELVNCEEDKLLVDAFRKQVLTMNYVMKNTDEMLTSLFNTVSWKITAPLRYFAKLVGRNPNK